jgi:hypothetical protein
LLVEWALIQVKARSRSVVGAPRFFCTFSLLYAEGPKRFFDAAGLGVLNQCQPGCFASLRARKFLCRYRCALNGPAEPANDNQNVDHDASSVVAFWLRRCLSLMP